jgi:hypothetical protein
MAVTATILTTLVTTGLSLYAQKQAGTAANMEAKYREQLGTRQADATRDATRENARRRLADRDRALSEVRARQAAAGFANAGTPLAVFGEYRSRLDDQIDEATNQGLDAVANYREQVKLSQWQTTQRDAASRLNTFATLIGGATSLGSGYYTGYRTTGKDPFSIFS